MGGEKHEIYFYRAGWVAWPPPPGSATGFLVLQTSTLVMSYQTQTKNKITTPVNLFVLNITISKSDIINSDI